MLLVTNLRAPTTHWPSNPSQLIISKLVSKRKPLQRDFPSLTQVSCLGAWPFVQLRSPSKRDWNIQLHGSLFPFTLSSTWRGGFMECGNPQGEFLRSVYPKREPCVEDGERESKRKGGWLVLQRNIEVVPPMRPHDFRGKFSLSQRPRDRRCTGLLLLHQPPSNLGHDA